MTSKEMTKDEFLKKHNLTEAEIIATSLKKVFGEDSVYVIAINELEGRKNKNE